MRFHRKTIKRLKEAGWYPNRRVDISQKIKSLDDLECFNNYNEFMLDFLKEFDNLSLDYSNDNLFSFKTGDSYFSHNAVVYRNGIIGEKCLLLGMFYNYNFEVLISESQKMYCYDEFENVYKIGSYYDEGLDFICLYGLNPRKHLESKIV